MHTGAPDDGARDPLGEVPRASGAYRDMDRPPLRQGALRRALEPDGWRVEVVERTGSTNADLAARAAADPGLAPGLVLVAEAQDAGRGRLDRTWVSPPRAGLTLSVLLRPALPRLGWVPLLAGLAVAEALRERAEVDAVLKWPNDVLVGDRKVCGLLAEAVDARVVVGIGLNVTTAREELPRPDATSLRLEDAATTDRDTVLRAVLRSLGTVLSAAEAGGGLDAYRERCTTLGRQVRLETPRGPVTGTAEAVDDEGRLVVDGVAHAAGDVVHVRGAG